MNAESNETTTRSNLDMILGAAIVVAAVAALVVALWKVVDHYPPQTDTATKTVHRNRAPRRPATTTTTKTTKETGDRSAAVVAVMAPVAAGLLGLVGVYFGVLGAVAT